MRPSRFLPGVTATLTAVLAAPTAPQAGVSLDELAGNPNLTRSLFQSQSLAGPGNNYAITANQVLQDDSCRPMTIIYARGTIQEGNIGTTGDVGPMLFNNLTAMVGANNLAVQGVDYPATIPGYLAQLAGIDAGSGQTMATLIRMASAKCPSTKLVLVGYSQGAQLVHDAASYIMSNHTLVNQIDAVVTFGDPDDSEAVGNIPPDKVTTFCHPFDEICNGGIVVLPPHLDYQDDAVVAARWLAKRVL